MVDLKNLRPDGTIGDPAGRGRRPTRADEADTEADEAEPPPSRAPTDARRTGRSAAPRRVVGRTTVRLDEVVDRGDRGRSRHASPRVPACSTRPRCSPRWPTSWSSAPSATPTDAWADRVHGALRGSTGGASRVPRWSTAASPSGVYAGLGAGPPGAVARASARSPSASVGPRLEDTAPRPLRQRGRQRAHRRPAGRASGRGWPSRSPYAVHGRDVPLRTRRPGGGVPGGDRPGGASSCTGCPRASRPSTGTATRVGATYADTLAELGWTPVLLRANTGLAAARERRGARRPAAATGRRLAGRGRPDRAGRPLDGRADHARRLRGGTRRGPARGTALVTDVVTLGTPHLGAPLAGGRRRGCACAGPAARDGGVRPDPRPALGRGARPRRRARTTTSRRCRTRATTWSRRPSPARRVTRSGRFLGDLLVRQPSAYGRSRRATPGCSPDADELHLPRAGHFDLLNHPQVHAALRDWLA